MGDINDNDPTTTCKCGSALSGDECCLAIIEGKQIAKSPEELMRSRYTAFCLRDVDYLWQTTNPKSRKLFDRDSNLVWAKRATFTKLEILESSQSGNEGRVEFKAYFDMDGEEHLHHEHASFVKDDGHWYFLMI